MTTEHSRCETLASVIASTTRSSEGDLRYTISCLEPDVRSVNSQLAKTLTRTVWGHWKQLKMVPIPFGRRLAATFSGNRLGGWHLGGTFAMRQVPTIGQCHPSGEVVGLKGVYIVDSSAFPEVPGSTIALLTAAHAYRVARRWSQPASRKGKIKSCR
ncbi:MAG: GMC oxidoreductase [Pirellula sp.]